MAEKTSGKKSTNPLVFIGIGCLVLIVIVGLVGSLVMRFFTKRVGLGLFQSAIESKTGVKTNLQDLEKGKMTFTDTKTGTKVDVGVNAVPDTFPKDFPVYPGAKVTSSLSGAQAGKNNGFWLTLATSDSFDAVTTYYKDQLTKNGWTVQAQAMYTQGTLSESVTKGTWSGTLTVATESKSKETQVVIILGQDDKQPTAEPTSSYVTGE